MLDAIATVLLSASIAVLLVSVVGSVAGPLGRRMTLAAIVGGWIGLAATVAASGALEGARTGPLALLFLFLTPLVAVALLAGFSPRARSVLLGIPTELLIGLNVIRAAGVMFLLLAAAGRLAGPFPYSAGWGDIITGVFAVPVALALARNANARGLVIAWNVFGTLDLVVAVLLGVFSASGSPIQLIHAGVGSAAITQLPWSLVPTVLVPYFLISHATVFAKLRGLARTSRSEIARSRGLAPAPALSRPA